MKPTVRSERAPAPQVRQGGFTLIELLVALAILALVAILAWRGLDQVARGRDSLARAMESERALSQLFGQMQSDLQQTVSDDEIGTLPVRTDQGFLQTVRELRVAGQPTRLEVVRYQLRDGHVLRYASPGIASVGQLQAALASDANLDNWSTIDLADGVTSAASRVYLPGRGWAAGMDPAQQVFANNLKNLLLPSGQSGPLPRSITGVEFKMHLLGQQGPLTRVFLVGE